MAEGDSKMNSLSSITRGATFYFVGKIVVDFFGFLLQLILTRSLGAGIYGLYAYGNTIAKIALVFTNLGSDESLLKYIPQYREETTKQRFIFGLATITSFSGGLIVATTLYLLSPFISSVTLDNPVFVIVLRIFSLIVFIDSLAKILYSVFRSLEFLEYEVITNKITRPVLRVFAITVAIGSGLSITGVMVGLAFASFLSLLVAIYFLLTRFEIRPAIPQQQKTKENVIEYYNFSVPLTLKAAGDILMKRVDILMVGFFLSSTAVGIYNISVLLAGFLILPLSAFNQLFPPIASRLYSNGDLRDLNSLYKRVTRWIFTISLIMAIGAIVYREEILILFGEEFLAGSSVLILFVVGQLFNCIGGANGYLLMMSERQYILVINQWIFGMLNVILNYIFIIEFGIIGAAAATAGILGLLNIVKTIELWYLEGLFPYSIQYGKPIFSGIITYFAMYVGKYILSGLSLLIVGLTIGPIIYAIILYGVGINEGDKEFFREVLRNRI